MTICKNCGNIFDGTYCNQCGQKANITRLDWHFIIQNIEHAVFHLEQGILFTIKQLFTRPGSAINDYIKGKRVKYTPPLSYLVIAFLAYFFLSKIFSTDNGNVYTSKLVGTMVEFMAHYYDKLMIVLIVPLSVLFTNVLFPKNPYNFFELFAFHCYMRAQFLLMELVVLFFDWSLVKFDVFLHPITIIGITITINIIYLCFSFSQFFEEKNIVRCFLKTFILMVILMAISYLIGLVVGSILIQQGIH